MKRMVCSIMAAILVLSALAGCSSTSEGGSVTTNGSTSMEKVILHR